MVLFFPVRGEGKYVIDYIYWNFEKKRMWNFLDYEKG